MFEARPSKPLVDCILKEFICFPIRKPFMHNLADGCRHLQGMGALEDVPSHIHAMGPSFDGIVSQGQGILLRKLLAACHYNGYRARSSNRS